MSKFVKFSAIFKGVERIIYLNPDHVEIAYDIKHSGVDVVCIETRGKQSMLVVKETLADVLAKLGLE